MTSTRTLLILAIGLFSSTLHADVRKVVKPTVTLLPTFDCAATPGDKGGTARITHSNAGEVSKTQLVVATVRTPSGTADATVCGSAFESEKTMSVSFVLGRVEKGFVYTCTAKLTSSPCPAVLH